MATKYNSVVSQNFTTSIGGAPAGGDTVYANQLALDYNAGVDLSAVDLAKFHQLPESKCNFKDGGGLKMVSTTGDFIYEGAGERFILQSIDATTVVNRIRSNPSRGNFILDVQNLKTNYLANLAGTMNISDSVDLPGDVYIFGGTAVALYHATHKIDGTLYALKGLMKLMRRADAASIGNQGVVELSEANATQGAYTLNGGRLTVKDSGTMDAFVGLDGVLDLTTLSRPWTVTAWTEHPNLLILKSRRTVAPTATPSQPFGPARVQYVD